MKNNKQKRLCSILLILAMLLPMTACSESSGETSGDTAAEQENANEVTADEAVETVEEEEAKLLPELPENADYGGEEIRLMQHPFQAGDWADWLSRDLYAESFNGEPLNDAVFARNTYVEDTLNVKLKVLDVADMPGAIKAQATAGTGDYHISTARIQSLPATVTGGYLQNLYSIDTIDLEKPWYDEKCIEDATFYDLLFYVTGSMIILDDDSTGAMLYNKQLITDYSLESPYELVKEGKWTLDKLAEMAEAVANDSNGNGEVDIEGDRFGLLWQRDAIVSYMHGGGGRIVSKDEAGEPVLTIGEENTINLFDKLDTFMFKANVVQNMHNYSSIYPDIYVGEADIFRANNALFMWLRMRVAENLRDMEADFGIIPVPKLNEAQAEYYSTVTKYTSATVCIPNDASLDRDMVGVVIELMSAEGHYGLREAYYEINLGKKIARDELSTEMLDIIMENRVYDAGEIYAIGPISDSLYSLSTGTAGIGIATLIAKNQKATEKMLDRQFITPMKELAEQYKD